MERSFSINAKTAESGKPALSSLTIGGTVTPPSISIWNMPKKLLALYTMKFALKKSWALVTLVADLLM